MNIKGCFLHESDEWYTPTDFFEELNKEFNFNLDPCATDDNHKCDKYFTREEDGLSQNWGGVQSVLQSALFRYCKLGGEVLRRGEKRKHIGCIVNPIKNRHKILS